MKRIKLKRYKNIIYEIYCIPSNTYYIGQTIKPLNDRISKHFSDAKLGRPQPLYDDMRLYERYNFTYREIECVQNANDLDDREKFWINQYIISNKKIYNKELGGRKGYIVSSDTKELMSKTKGTKTFIVYDVNKKYVGEFLKIVDVNKKLHTYFKNKYIKNGNCSKGYVCIYKEEFSFEKLDEIISNLSVDKNGKIKKKQDNNGTKNAMYGKGNKIYLYTDKKEFIKFFNTTSSCISYTKINKYSIKKYIDSEISYKGFIFRSTIECIRMDKDEESYN